MHFPEQNIHDDDSNPISESANNFANTSDKQSPERHGTVNLTRDRYVTRNTSIRKL
jgi:hypothetical protein